MQRHQKENNGYGLIVADEGHRLLSMINGKQNRSEGERGLLCKMWGGQGDFTTLRDSDRGFGATSMSMSVLIQPDPLLHELINMQSNDGFLDRILFLVSKPVMHKRAEVRAAVREFSTYPDEAITDAYKFIYTYHKESRVTYTLSDDATKFLDELSDGYADNFNRLYTSASGMFYFSISGYVYF